MTVFIRDTLAKLSWFIRFFLPDRDRKYLQISEEKFHSYVMYHSSHRPVFRGSCFSSSSEIYLLLLFWNYCIIDLCIYKMLELFSMFSFGKLHQNEINVALKSDNTQRLKLFKCRSTILLTFFLTKALLFYFIF